MTISAQIIADSISATGKRITTMQLRYPRFIHAELMTHRVFSRNASSSRAIPVKRLIQDIIDDTAMPMHWGKNQPGMQADEEQYELVNTYRPVRRKLGDGRSPIVDMEIHPVPPQEAWFDIRNKAIDQARAFAKAGYHKQIVNRLLEPFSHINVVVTATEWANFFGLRRHSGAQPEIHLLADRMFEVMAASTPNLLQVGEWHLPYITDDDWKCYPQDLVYGGDGYSYGEALDNLIKVSVARCARVSYLTHDGERASHESDIALYERLVGSVPLHASPAEHQATPDEFEINNNGGHWESPHLHGNFDGWIQYRKTLKHENIS